MASRLFARRLAVGASGACAAYPLFPRHARPFRCDSTSQSINETQRRPKALRRGEVIKQISAGTMLGVGSGLAISMFSKTLAMLVVLIAAGAAALEYAGIHAVPYTRVQRYLKTLDVRSTLQENIPFKLSFGVSFALASFGRLE